MENSSPLRLNMPRFLWYTTPYKGCRPTSAKGWGRRWTADGNVSRGRGSAFLLNRGKAPLSYEPYPAIRMWWRPVPSVLTGASSFRQARTAQLTPSVPSP